MFDEKKNCANDPVQKHALDVDVVESSDNGKDASELNEDSKDGLNAEKWICYLDAGTNKYYYFEPMSKVTVWDLPSGATVANPFPDSRENSAIYPVYFDQRDTDVTLNDSATATGPNEVTVPMDKDQLLSFYGLTQSQQGSNRSSYSCLGDKTVHSSHENSSNDYSIVGGFNACGHSVVVGSGELLPTYDRAQKQMNAYFDTSTLSSNRTEYKRMKSLRQNNCGGIRSKEDWNLKKEERISKRRKKEWNDL